MQIPENLREMFAAYLKESLSVSVSVGYRGLSYSKSVTVRLCIDGEEFTEWSDELPENDYD